MTSNKPCLWIPPLGTKGAALSVISAPFNPKSVLMTIHQKLNIKYQPLSFIFQPYHSKFVSLLLSTELHSTILIMNTQQFSRINDNLSQVNFILFIILAKIFKTGKE